MNLEITALVLFAGYCLTVSVPDRPDIFQVTHLATTLANRENKVQNLHQSPVPSFDTINLIQPASSSLSLSSSCNAAVASSLESKIAASGSENVTNQFAAKARSELFVDTAP